MIERGDTLPLPRGSTLLRCRSEGKGLGFSNFEVLSARPIRSWCVRVLPCGEILLTAFGPVSGDQKKAAGWTSRSQSWLFLPSPHQVCQLMEAGGCPAAGKQKPGLSQNSYELTPQNESYETLPPPWQAKRVRTFLLPLASSLREVGLQGYIGQSPYTGRVLRRDVQFLPTFLGVCGTVLPLRVIPDGWLVFSLF